MVELEKPIVQKIMKNKRSRSGKTIFDRKQIGVLVAGISPIDPENIVIGYSLCHRKDRYDHIKIGEGTKTFFKKCPGFGKNLATNRAIKWGNRDSIRVPCSIKKQMRLFMDRCSRYYKDKSFTGTIISTNLVPSTENLQLNS